MIKNTKELYCEVQTFRQGWIWLIILPGLAFAWYGFISQVILGIPFGTKPASDIKLIIFWGLFGVGLPMLFYFLRLITLVKEDGIYIRFVPFHFSFQKILFNELQKYEVRKYSPIMEYGGWGIRYGSKGKAYNVSGDIGLQLELKNGKRILIGTQRPEEFLKAVNEAVNKAHVLGSGKGEPR